MKDRLQTVAFPILLACLLTPLLVFAGDETNDGGVKVREQNGIPTSTVESPSRRTPSTRCATST